MTTNLTAPANSPANGPITVKLITRLVLELRRYPTLQYGGDMA